MHADVILPPCFPTPPTVTQMFFLCLRRLIMSPSCYTLRSRLDCPQGEIPFHSNVHIRQHTAHSGNTQ